MQIRPMVLMGLALANLAGCQSYFPNGYSNAGPYSAFPPQGYGPPPTGAGSSTTFQPRAAPPNGQITTEGPPLNNKYAPAKGQNSVPNPREPGAPSSLGTPANDDGDETIRRGTSRIEKQPARLSGLTDESEETLAAFGDDEEFAKPRQIEATAATDDGDDMPRTKRQSRPNPYRYDKKGYTWLRGTVSRDQGGRWRLRYSDNALDGDDQFGGTLELVGDDKFETLLEDDVVLVKGRVDPATKDTYGKPSYLVESLEFLVPKTK